MVSKTPDTSLTRDMIRQSATSAIYARGNNYFKMGRVLECIEIEPGVVEGTVRGSGSNTYSTNVDFANGYIISDCSCPYGWSDVCKHAVALALEYLHLSRKPDYRQPNKHIELNPFGQRVKAVDSKETAWREVLDKLVEPVDPESDTGSYRVIYRLEIAWSGKLFLRTSKARIGKRGKGKESFYHYDQFAPSSFLRSKDCAILGLKSNNAFMRSVDTISDDILDPLLRLLHDEEYVYAGESENKALILLAPIWAGLILEEQEETGDHTLRVSLKPDDAVEHSKSLFIVGEDKPWITDGQTFQPLATGVPGSVLAGLLNQPRTISKNELDSFMESYYDALAQKEAIEIRSSLLNDIRNDIPPRPVIYLEGEGGALIVKPCFAYGDGPPQVETGSTAKVVVASNEEKSIWVRRQPEAELKVYRQLDEEGVAFDSYGFGRLDGEAALDFLYNSIDKLRNDGWEIVNEAASLRINRNSPKVSATTSSGIDWFDLQFAFEYGNLSADLPAVLAAYRSGRKYIRMDDGSWGALPLQWLKKSNPLLDELTELDPMGKTGAKKHGGNRHLPYGDHDGFLRVRSHHIPLMEEIVSDVDIRSTLKLNELRTRLASFDGLQKVDAPDGLNATLRDYQKHGLDWLAFLSSFSFGGILADDMGLGKTIQTLAHLLKQKEQSATEQAHPSMPSLIVAPTSVAYNWKEEAAHFTPDLNVLVLTGPDRHDRFEKISGADIVVTTYALLRRDFETLNAYTYQYIVLDEAQYIKNPVAQTSKMCKALTASHRLALTGTPIENNLTELWSIFDFLMPGFLGSHKSFRDRYEKPIAKAAKDNNGDKDIDLDADAGDAMERLKKRIRPFILRRLKQEVATELPPKTETISYCEMTPAQSNLYRQVLNTYRAKVFEAIDNRGVERSQITILDALLKLRQVCNHPQLIKLASNNVQSSGKMDALKEMVEQITSEGHKALVFSQFTRMLSVVREWLDERSVPYCYLDGRTRNRQQVIDSFSEGDSQLFLISLKAGGTGLNLTAADYVIHIDPWWNPAVENQATDRAHRIGQDKHVFVYKLITKDSVEEKILKLQERKKELVDNLLQEGRIGRSLSREDLDDLFSI